VLGPAGNLPCGTHCAACTRRPIRPRPAGPGHAPLCSGDEPPIAEILRDHQRAAGQHARGAAWLARQVAAQRERRSRRSAVAAHVRPGLPSAHSLCRAACHGGHRSPVPIRC